MAAAVVVARLELLQADEIFGVDDRLLHGAPAFAGRMAGEIFAPHGEGLRVFLLPVVDLAQRPAGLGQFFAIFPARVLQEVLERGHGLVIVGQVELTLGDLQVGGPGQFVRGKAVDEILQRRDAPAEIFVVAGLGAVPRLGQVEGRLGRPITANVAGTLRVPSAPAARGLAARCRRPLNSSRQALRASGSLPAASRHSPSR